jgi:adenylate kinase
VRLLLVGPPGAGKGTQAAVLSEKLGVPHISTGDLFRAHIGDGTELGVKVKHLLDTGQLVPDDLTNELVRERLADADTEGGFILDGFPRNIGQAKVLAGMLDERGHKLDAVLEFDVPDEELVQRLLARGRSDDNETVIRDRQRIYREETAPLLDHYADILIKINAVGEVNDITARALDALKSAG